MTLLGIALHDMENDLFDLRRTLRIPFSQRLGVAFDAVSP